jgi:hypothetical protein
MLTFATCITARIQLKQPQRGWTDNVADGIDRRRAGEVRVNIISDFPAL